tara:strand:- start:494 stop:1942 length:1449 start_codon:yes stop_codon:yes gene_type:complete
MQVIGVGPWLRTEKDHKMNTMTYVKRSQLNYSATTVFNWHCREGAFERLNPPWQPAETIEKLGSIEDNGTITIKTKIGPLSAKWFLKHTDFIQDRQFADILIKGPFSYWKHIHKIEPQNEDTCILEDEIEYSMHGGIIGNILGGPIVKNLLQKMFTYRHNVLRSDLRSHSRHQPDDVTKILISGSTGLIGQALSSYLSTGGHQVVRLVRNSNLNDEGTIFWDPLNHIIDSESLEGFDYVIHLAGENVGESRWTKKKKARISDSRINSTKFLAESLSNLKCPPKALLCASATGYYGDAGNDLLNEQSPNGTGFLAQVVDEWERSTRSATDQGIRVVNLRFGVVINPMGGALKKLLMPFKLGFGGKIGHGKQYMSWISLDDAICAIHHLMIHSTVEGPINIASPNTVTNEEFTKQLGTSLRRPTVATIPAFIIKIMFGQMGKETILASTRVDSTKLSQSGYAYIFPRIEEALEHYLGKSKDYEI